MTALIKNKKRGVAAVEFGLIFPLLFLLLYSILTYALIFSLQHALSMAAAEGGRTAIKYQSKSDSVDVRIYAACAQMEKNLDFFKLFGYELSCHAVDEENINRINSDPLSANVHAGLCSPQNQNLYCIYINLVFNYGENAIFPRIIIPTPENLSGKSTTQFSLRF